MQPQSSSASAPMIAPPQTPRAPEVVPSRPEPPKRRGRWVVGAVILAAVAGGLYVRQRSVAPAPGTARPPVVVIRTAKVAGGTVYKTIRLTGSTKAEKYASMMSPQLRGSRSGRGRQGGGGGGSSQSSSSNVASNDSRSSSGGSTAVASTSAALANLSSGSGSSSTSSTMPSGTSGGARSASSAFQAATSRVGRSSSSRSSGSSSGRSSSSGSSSALGSEGMGSTSSELSGGSGGPAAIGSSGGGGRGDFMLVLQNLIRPGSRVTKGDFLAEFDRQYMLTRLDDYRASVVQSEAGFKKTLAELDVSRKAHEQSIRSAQADVDKAKLDIQTTPVRSAIDSERLRLTLEEAEARLKQLQNEVKQVAISEQAQVRISEIDLEQSKLELRRAETNAEKMVMRAPIDGLTVMQNTFQGGEFRQIQQGDQLYPGMQFMQVVDPSSMVVDAYVNQVDVEKMRVGAKAVVRFDAFPNLQLPARVFSVGTVTKSSRFRADFVKEIPVKLKLEKMDPRVIPDLSVSANVIIGSEEAAAVLPLDALFQDSAGGSAFVFIRQPSGWERREVELGLTSHTTAAVRSGLKAGEVIALERPPATARR